MERARCAASPADRTGTSTSAPAASRCGISRSCRAASTKRSRPAAGRRPVPRVPVALVGVCLALAGVRLAAHAFSVSYAQVTIADRTIAAVVRLPLDDVDLLLRIDRDLDGRVSPSEIQASAALLSAYFAKHLHVTADAVALTPTIAALTIWRDASGFEYLQASAASDAGRPVRVVSIRTDFLVELYPAHTTQAQIAAGGREERFVFRPGATYERRVADARWAAPALVAGAAAGSARRLVSAV